MVKNFEDMQKFGRDGVEATLKTVGVFSKNWQTIAREVADYSKKVFEESAAATEQLIGAKFLDRAIEVQTSYLKNAYEGFVAHSAKLGELYADLVQETCKPVDAMRRPHP